MATPPVSPRKLFLVKPSTIGSVDVPSFQKGSVRPEQLASKLSLSGRSQSECQLKPGRTLPRLPHSVSQSEVMVKKQPISQQGSLEPINTGLPAATLTPYLKLRPVRRPPDPPIKTLNPLLSHTPIGTKSKEVTDESTFGRISKSSTVFGKNKPPPLPVPLTVRPNRTPGMCRSFSDTSVYPLYESTLPFMDILPPQGPVEHKRRLSHHLFRPPALLRSKPLPYHGDCDDTCGTSNLNSSDANSEKSVVPSQPPTPPLRPSVSRSPSGVETTPTQLQSRPQPPVSPRKLFLFKSSTNAGSVDVPSSQKDSVRPEQLASKLSLSGRSQSECQLKPGRTLPRLPRSISQSEVMVKKQPISQQGSLEPDNTGLPAATLTPYLKLRPVRRPPDPPIKTTDALLSHTPIGTKSQEVTDESSKSSDANSEKSGVPSQPPTPPLRPSFSRSPSGVETTPTQLQPQPQSIKARRRASHSPPTSFKPPPPPPPPPRLNKPSLSDRPANLSLYESFYSEISEEHYLNVVPDKVTFQLEPSDRVNKTPAAPRFQAGQRYQNGGFREETEQEFENLMRWKKTVGRWENISPSSYGLSLEDETREFDQRGIYVSNGLRLFNCLLMKHSDNLHDHIAELSGLADKLDKWQNRTRTMGIAGGATGAVGGAAAIAGIALAPVTLGASLVATALGAGMVVSASGIGAKAAIVKKKTPVDRKMVEEAVRKYKDELADVEWSLGVVWSGTEELRRFDVHRLSHADPEALRMAKMAEALHRSGCDKSQKLGMKSEVILQGFAKDLDLHYTAKDGQNLKKGSETDFAVRIREVMQELQGELNELHDVWHTFSLVVCRC
ncbi:hypothetical protein DPEC_G00275270 [Dallia pectoralis]|uniref:Uncharacterized protein n=1 Tax=Dallia pectoralis TaxID=75939 RepID=A0ACC2FL97_DALPE|nr:hypothetical protein DPEC_G00275270 [Dallia pectoralis]